MMYNSDPYKVTPVKRAAWSYLFFMMLFSQACTTSKSYKMKDLSTLHLMILAPGHFHAALLQKYRYSQIDSTVHVFAPEGPELKAYLALIDRYNTRADDPTGWKEKVYAGPGYVEKMLKEKPGNVVVIAGKNQDKTDYIKRSVEGGVNVLADKPMVITTDGFDQLRAAFADARKNKVLLYDIMTERYEITNNLQKEFSRLPSVFGELKKGTLEEPAITVESVHYFYKEVSGSPLVRPAWYFDVRQQGEGITDVATHLVDLIQWGCFPETILDYEKDIRMLTARHWATVLTPSEFTQVTNEKSYPDFLKNDVKDSLLSVYANGEMNYTIKGVHVRVSVIWKYRAPEGAGDTYYSNLQGTKANLVIRQGKEEHYKPVLYITPVAKGLDEAVANGLGLIRNKYPGIDARKSGAGWELIVPERYYIGHEQQFALVVKNYIGYLQKGAMPEWEIAGMLAKYYTLTQALKRATRP
ncbi:MAG TPA: putative oxidoreductase C-terminal domain-containing protein [Puia sp.]